VVAGELFEGTADMSEDGADVVGESCGVAGGDEAQGLGVLFCDRFGQAGGNHRLLVFVAGSGLERDRTVEDVGECCGDVALMLPVRAIAWASVRKFCM
jgi:hypothetical protein